MSLIEVKNNLLKFSYDEDLVLSGFVRVTDSKNSYIAQVLHLEATRVGKVAIAKILFMYNDEKITSYNGSIPSLRAEISAVDSSILLNSLEKTHPLNLGVLAQQNEKLFVDMSILDDNPIICAEKFFATKVFLNNLAIQLQLNGKKVVVFDTVGAFKSNKLTVCKDFKLPLNTSAINYIYEYGFEDATPDTKALIQSIFEELSEYSKTVPFIPFNSFKSVVDAEFNRTKLIQLILLKNKIKQIGDLNIYGETDADFAQLVSKIQTENTILIDVSNIAGSLQRECIKYVYSLLEQSQEEFYAFLPLSNENSDKEVLSTIHNSEKVHTTVICGYDYKYTSLLKQTSKNMFMFTPLKQQRDFGGYNIFLQKLAEDECIAYGKMTKFVPLIVKLHQLKPDEVQIIPQTVAQPVQPQPVVEPSVQTIQPAEKVDNTMVENFVNSITPESVNIQTTQAVEPVVIEPVVEETPMEAQPIVKEVIKETIVEQPVEMADEVVVEEVSQEPAQAPGEEISIEEAPQAVEEEVVEPQNDNSILEELAVSDEEEEEDDDIDEDEYASDELLEEPQTASEEELTQALNEVPDIEDDEELSDDDLDMIEELSKPEEEQVAAAPAPASQPAPQPQVAPQPVQQQAPQQPQVAPQPIPAPQPAQPKQPQQITPDMMENSKNPTVPVYSADIPDEDRVNRVKFQQGDRVLHEEFGEGVVEKMIAYGDKELCSINFGSVGRRLLNPEITEMRKI